MNPEDFNQLIAAGENERLEFKSSGTPSDILARAVCAFLNQKGGRVMLGVGDRGNLIGVQDASGIVSRVKSELPRLISPQTLWTVDVLPVDGREIVVIEVPEGKDKPYVTGGGIYFRRGERIVAATRDEISALIQLRIDESHRWERQIVMGADESDLDKKLIAETVKMAAESERWNGAPNDGSGLLHALGLLTQGGVTNGALILFGKQPSRLFPQARVRLVVMPEGKTGNRYAFDKTFDDCLLRLAEQIPAVLEAHIGGVHSQFSEAKWQRDERVLYPPTAIREGVMNALAHRDYALNGSILISVLPDRLRITNPGGLPDQLSPADLKKDHPSVPRNPDIAHVFFLRRLIEKLGRGTQRIIEDCRANRLKEPRWNSSQLETGLTFFAPRALSGQPIQLTERQERILEAAGQRRYVKLSDIERLFGGQVTDRTLRSDLQTLIEAGRLLRSGRGRNTAYRAVPKTEV